MSVRRLLTPAAVDAYTLTTGRVVGTVAVLVALTGVVISGLALASRIGNGKRGAIVGLVAGLTGMVIGGLVVAVAEGGPGTGYGVVGGFAALVVGLIATVLGWLALNRSRRVQDHPVRSSWAAGSRRTRGRSPTSR